MTIAILFILGLFVGSFLNLLIYRLPREQNWIKGRSHCDHCKKQLTGLELIPVFSWIFLKGKCKKCRKSISPLNPVVELLNASAWALIAWAATQNLTLSGIGTLGWSGLPLLHTITTLTLASTLLVIFIIDLQHYIIPDQTVVVMVVLGLVLGILNLILPHPGGVIHIGSIQRYMLPRLAWGFGSLAFFLLLNRITRGKGMGWGDVKLVFAMGIILGKSTLIALMSAFMIGAIVGVGLLTAKIRKLKQPIPFGPFLVIGMIIALIYGNRILQWYLGGII